MTNTNTTEQQKTAITETLDLQLERFCLAMANGATKYEAYDIAEYKGKSPNGRAVAVCRLLKREEVVNRIIELQREIMLAKGITEDRILGNLAGIAFNESQPNGDKPSYSDRIRSLDLLGKKLKLWTDSVGSATGGLTINVSVADNPKKQVNNRIVDNLGDSTVKPLEVQEL